VPEPDKNSSSPSYKWPWFVLAAVVLGILLMIAWVGFAALREKQQRDFNAPLPTQSH
jgi:hypothetical protein